MQRGFAIIFSFLAVSSSALSVQSEDTNNDGTPDQWLEMDGEKPVLLKADRNYDGEVDLILSFDEQGQKKEESMDFNHDGTMDDIYYYENGVLKRREIDTNYDGKIDLWVDLDEGVYIRKFQRDVDFDGIVDLIKSY